MKKIDLLLLVKEIKMEISPYFSSKIKIKNTSYKGYNVVNLELDKPKLDQTFFPILRVAGIKINGKEKIGFYLIHSKLHERKLKWRVEKIIIKSNCIHSIY